MCGRRFISLVATVGILLASACGGNDAASDDGKDDADRITIGFSSAADVGDLATLIALERLEEDGTEVETVFFGQPELVTQALLANEIDVAIGAVTTALSAVQAQEAPIRIFLNQIRNEWVLWSNTGATTCSELEDENIGVHSTSGASFFMVQTWFQEEGCEEPEYTVVPGSDVRASAMIAGEMDTSLLEIGDALLVESERPGEYKEVVNFSEELPELLTIGFFTTEEYLDSNRELLTKLAEIVQSTNQELTDNPELAASAISDHLEAADERTSATAQAYAELELWPTEVGLTEEAISYSLEFYTSPAAQALEASGLDRLTDAFELSIVGDAET